MISIMNDCFFLSTFIWYYCRIIKFSFLLVSIFYPICCLNVACPGKRRKATRIISIWSNWRTFLTICTLEVGFFSKETVRIIFSRKFSCKEVVVRFRAVSKNQMAVKSLSGSQRHYCPQKPSNLFANGWWIHKV